MQLRLPWAENSQSFGLKTDALGASSYLLLANTAQVLRSPDEDIPIRERGGGEDAFAQRVLCQSLELIGGHAEKYYPPASEEFAATRAAFE